MRADINNRECAVKIKKRHGLLGLHRFKKGFIIRENLWNPWRFVFDGLGSAACRPVLLYRRTGLQASELRSLIAAGWGRSLFLDPLLEPLVNVFLDFD